MTACISNVEFRVLYEGSGDLDIEPTVITLVSH